MLFLILRFPHLHSIKLCRSSWCDAVGRSCASSMNDISCFVLGDLGCWRKSYSETFENRWMSAEQRYSCCARSLRRMAKECGEMCDKICGTKIFDKWCDGKLWICWTLSNQVSLARALPLIISLFNLILLAIVFSLLWFKHCFQLQTVTRDSPLKIGGESLASLLVCEPFSHLLDVTLLVGSLIGIFGKINVKTFWALTAVAIGRSTGDDHSNIVLHWMKFWDITVVLAQQNSWGSDGKWPRLPQVS